MKSVERFLLGGVLGLVAILALSTAARHGAGAGYWGGLLVFALCVGLIFSQIADARFGAARGAEPSILPLPPILRNLAALRANWDRATNTMNAIEKFVLGGVLGLFAVIALFAAARHGEGASYWGGIAVFVFMIGLIFYQITRSKFGGEGDASH